jgi:hypothetical protein
MATKTKKNKLLKNITKKNKPKQPILFMFLGGLPSDASLLRHYNLFFDKNHDKSSLYIVVHPKDIDTFEVNKLFHHKVHIVDKDHWIQTNWETRSLTDATLLMMQFSFLKFGDIFKKYVLLSPMCAPLYNYSILYNEFTKDNKSWIQCSSNKYVANYATDPLQFYTFSGGPFDINTITYQSQWMALDRQHVTLFFTLNNGKMVKTYQTVTSSEIQSSNKLFQSYLDAYKVKLLHPDIYFFISVLSKLIKDKKDVVNMMRILDQTQIFNIVKYKWITNFKKTAIKVDSDLFKIYTKAFFGINKKFKLSLKRFKTINPEHLKEIYYVFQIDEKKYIYKHGVPVLVDTNEPYIKIGHKKGIDINTNTTPLTYVDWSCISCSPSNFLRSYDLFLKEKSILFPPISTFLTMPTATAIDTIQQLEKDITSSTHAISTFSISNIPIKPTEHPFEYSSYKLQEIINICNLLHMMRKHMEINELYTKAYDQWTQILRAYKARENADGYTDVADPTSMVGSAIDSNVLNNALSSGALFIRKIQNHSLIDTYSEQLFNMKDYVPNLYNKMQYDRTIKFKLR